MLETVSEKSTIATRSNRTDRAVYELRPLEDPRWDALLQRHPSASVFHSRPWLEALRRTYGYESFAYTTSPLGEPLSDGHVFCSVESWLTGRRLVSLPFSDHCDPLVQETEDLHVFVRKLQQEARSGKWRYIEMRPLESLGLVTPLRHASAKYTLHRVDLRRDLPTLFRSFHKNSIQRKIKRAEREGLIYQEGTTEAILDAFYRLLTVTRRRHGVPPQPKVWFRNLIECFGSALQISVASKGRRPVAAMLTLRHKNTLVYKYGGSESQFNNLGSMHCLYWKAIQRAKALGLEVFDLGRTDADQSGLIMFKSRWGATLSNLTYFRFAPSSDPMHWFESRGPTWKTRVAKTIVAHSPTALLPGLGNRLYRHIG